MDTRRALCGALTLLAISWTGAARADDLAALSDTDAASATGGISVAAGDLDGDGAPDLAAAFPDHVLVRYGNGSETALPHEAAAVAIRDGSLYLALEVGALLEIDTVTGAERMIVQGLSAVTSLSAGDFDGDGAADLLVADSGAVLAVRAGDDASAVLEDAGAVRRIVPGDFSGDGVRGLVLETVEGALLLPDAVSGGWRAVDTPGFDGGLAAMDPDGDGRDDLLGLLGGELLLLEPESSAPAFRALDSPLVLARDPFVLFRIAELFRGTFLRGDPNSDASVDISDALAILLDLFGGVPARAECRKALDVDDSGVLDTTDAIRLLDFLFRGGPAPPAPFPEDGEDPTPDAIPCV